MSLCVLTNQIAEWYIVSSLSVCIHTYIHSPICTNTCDYTHTYMYIFIHTYVGGQWTLTQDLEDTSKELIGVQQLKK